MKKQAGIWIDGKSAILVLNDTRGELIEVIESNISNKVHHDVEGDKGSFMGQQHINRESTFEERKHHQLDQFMKVIVDRIDGYDDVYILGPSVTKIKLKTKLEKQKSAKFNITGIDACDYLTHNQIVSKVRDHFRLG